MAASRENQPPDLKTMGMAKRVRKRGHAALKEAEDNAHEQKAAAISSVIAALAISGGEAEEQVRVLMTEDSQDSATALKIMVKSVMKSN
jgi:hypothetical protein